MHVLWLIVRAALIVAAGVLAGSWLEGAARSGLDRSRLDPVVREVFVRLVRPLLVVLAALAAVASLGVSANGAVAVLAAAVLAIGLSWRETMANGAAGALLLTWRPYRTGDRVKLAGYEGTVTDLTMYATTMKTDEGAHVTLPNRIVLDHPVENLSRNGLLRVDATFTVVATADCGKLGNVLVGLLAEDERFAKEPTPSVLAERVTAEGLRIRVRAWVRAEAADEGRSALVLVVRDALKKAKIELSAVGR